MKEEVLATKMKLLNGIVDTKDDVVGIIYKITNAKTGKCYVGQTVSHKLNHKRYRPFGEQKRLKQHVSDALNNTKKKQCSYLNNAIRKYGPTEFTSVVLRYCLPEEANALEIQYIKDENTLFPNGYNLTEGGMKGPTTQHQREKLMAKSHEQYLQQKIQRFRGVMFDKDKLDQYIREYHHERYGGTYFKVRIKGINSIFVAQHLPYNEKKQMVYDFLHTLAEYNMQHNQIAGTS